MRALASWCGALAGLLAILIGGLIPAALFLPAPEPFVLPLPPVATVAVRFRRGPFLTPLDRLDPVDAAEVA